MAALLAACGGLFRWQEVTGEAVNVYANTEAPPPSLLGPVVLLAILLAVWRYNPWGRIEEFFASGQHRAVIDSLGLVVCIVVALSVMVGYPIIRLLPGLLRLGHPFSLPPSLWYLLLGRVGARAAPPPYPVLYFHVGDQAVRLPGVPPGLITDGARVRVGGILRFGTLNACRVTDPGTGGLIGMHPGQQALAVLRLFWAPYVLRVANVLILFYFAWLTFHLLGQVLSNLGTRPSLHSHGTPSSPRAGFEGGAAGAGLPPGALGQDLRQTGTES